MLRGVVPTKEAGRGRLLRGVVGAEAGVPPPAAGLLSSGMPLPAPPPFRACGLVEAEPLMVGLT